MNAYAPERWALEWRAHAAAGSRGVASAAVKGIDSRILKPRETWNDKEAFDVAARNLVKMLQDNFGKFESVVQADVMPVAMSA